MEGCGISFHHLGLDSNKCLFVTAQIPALNAHVFIYRFIVTLYFTAFNAWYIPYKVTDYGWTFFIYLTNWTFIVLTLYLLVTSFNSLSFYLARHHKEDIASPATTRLPFKYKLQWCLYYIAANISMIVTVVYWVALYSYSSGSLFVQLNVHALTSLVGILETLMSATPVRLIHVAYPLCYGIIYVVFTIIYWVAGGTDDLNNPFIYPILDYGNEPVKAFFSVFGCIVGVFVSQFILWMLYNLRLCLTRTSAKQPVLVEDNKIDESGL